MNHSVKLTFNAIKKSILIFIFLMSFYVIYYVTLKKNILSGSDIVLIIMSVSIMSVSICSIFDNGIRTDNIFFLSFYTIVYLNQFDISDFQEPKGGQILYYLSLGPILFGLLFQLAENIPNRISIIENQFECQHKKDSWKYVLVVYLFLKLILLSHTGIRFFLTDYNSESESLYTIPGLSGLISILYYVLLMQTMNLKGKKRVSIILLVTLFEGVFQAHRGEIMRIALFVLLGFAIKKGRTVLNRNNVKILGILLCLIIVFFGIAGQYRQNVIYTAAGATQAFSISLKLRSRINNPIICWFYMYTGFNIEVLRNSVESLESGSNRFGIILLPLVRIIQGNSKIEDYYQRMAFGDFGGINAATFLKPYIVDMGNWYFIELLVGGAIYIILIRYSLKKSISSYVFILLLVSLSLFGDYMFSVNRFYALIANLIYERMMILRSKENITHEKRFSYPLRTEKSRA